MMDGGTQVPIAFSADRLTKRYGTVRAVDAISLSVPGCGIFGLLGRNGAGKSTTIKMLTTLLPPTSGTATVAGFDVVRQPLDVRRRIGYVPQMPSADVDLTGYENLLIFAKLYVVPRSMRAERIDDALSFMGLQEYRNTLVGRYSGGLRRRLEMAQSMLHRPQVLFLDEPTEGLDPVARHAVWERLRALPTQFGTTVVLTTHYMDEAEALCDRVCFLHQGSIAAEGTPGELKAKAGEAATLDDVFLRVTGGPTEESA
jgi:ABC-2 type transport system ATP-binding protein